MQNDRDAETTQNLDFDDYLERSVNFYKTIIPALTSKHPWRQLQLLFELTLNPCAVLLMFLQYRFLSPILRGILSLSIPVIFFLAPFQTTIIGWRSGVAWLMLWISASLLLNLVVLFINASVLRVHSDVSVPSTPAVDLWRNLSAPVSVQRLLEKLTASTASPARGIPIALLSRCLDQSIRIPSQHDEKTGNMVFTSLSSYEYSAFLCECIDSSWESLYWVVDPVDFRKKILPSFIAEAIVIAGVVRFDERLATKLQLCELEHWASGKTLKTIFAKVIPATENEEACLYCLKQSECKSGSPCHIVNLDRNDIFLTGIDIFHANLSLVWHMLFSYAKKNLSCCRLDGDFSKIWEKYDGFSISCVFPHTERFRAAATQVKKRFIYVDIDTLSCKGVLKDLKLLKADGELNSSYVSSVGPEVDLSNLCIRGWAELSSKEAQWSPRMCSKILVAAFELFRASCGKKTEVAFFNRESGGKECVEEWGETIDAIEGFGVLENSSEDSSQERVPRVPVDIGVFDRFYCVGSIPDSSVDGKRRVLTVFPSPSRMNIPFAAEKKDSTLPYEDVLKCLNKLAEST